MRFLSRLRRRGRLRKLNSSRILRHLRPPLPDPEPNRDRCYALLEVLEAEELAARAAKVGGGGSPVWGGVALSQGEELALHVEVSRALQEQDHPPWHKVGPYISLS